MLSSISLSLILYPLHLLLCLLGEEFPKSSAIWKWRNCITWPNPTPVNTLTSGRPASSHRDQVLHLVRRFFGKNKEGKVIFPWLIDSEAPWPPAETGRPFTFVSNRHNIAYAITQWYTANTGARRHTLTAFLQVLVQSGRRTRERGRDTQFYSPMVVRSLSLLALFDVACLVSQTGRANAGHERPLSPHESRPECSLRQPGA